jgi:hypothetical protein
MDWGSVEEAAVREFPGWLFGLIPSGRMCRDVFVATNPVQPGAMTDGFSVFVNKPGRIEWADMASQDGKDNGRSAISLVGYLRGIAYGQAKRELERLLDRRRDA